MSDDLLIKISADAKDVTTAFDNIKSKSEDLEDALTGIAKVSGVAFAALTAQVTLSVKAFADSENASLALSNALQNQGIYTDQLKESYKQYAEVVSAQTGFSTVQITQAQAVAQAYLGQIPVTEKLTQAIADYSVKAGGTTEAAIALGKAIGNGTGMLLREGIQFSATSTEAERYAQVLDFINAKYAGAATAVDPVTLATRNLKTAFEENEAELGSRFAPAFTMAIDAMTSFIKPSKDANDIMIDLKASLIGAGIAITGAIAGAAILGKAFITIRAALIAMNVQLSLTQALLAGLGIGLIAIAITELVLHFAQVSAVVKVLIQDFRQFGDIALGVATILGGLAVLRLDVIEDGIKQVGDAFKKVGTDSKEAWNTANTETQKGATQQIAIKAELAAKEQALRNQKLSDARAVADAERAYVVAQNQGQSEAILQIKKQEIETLKALAAKNAGESRADLQAHYKQLQAEERAQAEQDLEIQKEFDKEDKAAREEHGNSTVQIQTEADKKQLAAIKAGTDTQATAQKKVYLDDLKEQQKAHNQFLNDQIKYGTAYAAINEAMHSAVYQGTKQAFGDLAELQQSSNSTLKTVGQIAAVANIVIKTAESAMNIYAGFSTIPIIGPALGIAGAAAAVAFGAEQIQKVTAAQVGGLVGGQGYGDSQPYMLEPGELVTPKKNFDEVVTSVAQQRGYVTGDESQGGQSQNVNVTIGFDGRDAQQVLTARRIEDQSLGVYRGRT